MIAPARDRRVESEIAVIERHSANKNTQRSDIRSPPYEALADQSIGSTRKQTLGSGGQILTARTLFQPAGEPLTSGVSSLRQRLDPYDRVDHRADPSDSYLGKAGFLRIPFTGWGTMAILAILTYLPLDGGHFLRVIARSLRVIAQSQDLSAHVSGFQVLNAT